jgi:hypothetical protein
VVGRDLRRTHGDSDPDTVTVEILSGHPSSNAIEFAPAIAIAFAPAFVNTRAIARAFAFARAFASEVFTVAVSGEIWDRGRRGRP